MSSRTDVKDAVWNVLQGTPGVKAIFKGEPKEIQQMQMPCVIISIPDTNEERGTASAPRGKKHIEYTVQLKVFHIDAGNDSVAGELTFDALLDEIDAHIRADVTLGGAVAAAAVQYLKTDVAQPQLLEGRTVARLAIKKFDVTKWVTG